MQANSLRGFYFVVMGPMARIRVDRRGRALACEAPSGEKSLSLNFSRQGCQFRIRDRTSSGCEACSYREITFTTALGSLQLNLTQTELKHFILSKVEGWECFKYKGNRNACHEYCYPNGVATLSNLNDSSY